MLSILVGLLVLLNIIVLSFLLIGKKHNGPGPNKHNPERHGNHIKERFDFDDSQVKMFEISKSKHMELTKDLSSTLKEASLAYYNEESENTNKDSLYSDVMSITQKIYEANDTHFDEVRKICTAEQLPAMNDFIKGLLNRKGPRRSKKGRRK